MNGFFLELTEQVQDYLPGAIARACEPGVNGWAEAQRQQFRAQDMRDQVLLDRIWQQQEHAHDESLGVGA